MAELDLIKQFTPGAAGVWALVAMCALTLIKGWPALKKIGIEADASLRADLLKRITDLESQLANERLSFASVLAQERLAFAKELAGERLRRDDEIRELKEEIAGLHSMIRQNSQSTAYMLGDPDGLAVTKATRKERGEKP